MLLPLPPARVFEFESTLPSFSASCPPAQVFEFESTLPGPSKLTLKVFDHDAISTTDDLIGLTTIDLEDRCVHVAP